MCRGIRGKDAQQIIKRLETIEEEPDSFTVLPIEEWPCRGIELKSSNCVGPFPNELQANFKARFIVPLEIGFRCQTCLRIAETRGFIDNARQPFLDLLDGKAANSGAFTPGVTAFEMHRTWSLKVEALAIHLFHEEWDLAGFGPIPAFAFCLCGSLAKLEGSLYSDIDGFLLVEPESMGKDVINFKAVWARVDRRLRFAERKVGIRLCDGGLSPAHIVYTPKDLVDMLHSPAWEMSHKLGCAEGRFVSGKRALFERFSGLLLERQNGGPDRSLRKLTNLVTKNHEEHYSNSYFTERIDPDNRAVRVNIKDDVYRPIQTVLKLLACYYGIKELSSRNQVFALLEKGKMSPDVANALINALEEYGRLRFESHQAHGEEMDEIFPDTPFKCEAIRTCKKAVTMLWPMIEMFVGDEGYNVFNSPLTWQSVSPDGVGPRVLPNFTGKNWTPDKLGQCEICNNRLRFMNRHHCRQCGKLVCDKCSKNRAILPGSAKPVRVCDGCVR